MPITIVEKNFYFTFPQKSELRNAYMIVEAKDIAMARGIFIAVYGKPIFAFVYEEADFLPQVVKYDLYKVDFGYMPEAE